MHFPITEAFDCLRAFSYFLGSVASLRKGWSWATKKFHNLRDGRGHVAPLFYV